MVSVPPSPKSQDHAVGKLLEASVKLTAKGPAPLVGVPAKSATGAAAPSANCTIWFPS